MISNANWSRKRISSRTTWPPSRFIWFCWYQTLTEVEDYCFESHVIHSWLRRLFNQILTEVEVYQFESHGLHLGLCSCRYPTLTEVEEGYHIEPHDLPLGFCGCRYPFTEEEEEVLSFYATRSSYWFLLVSVVVFIFITYWSRRLPFKTTWSLSGFLWFFWYSSFTEIWIYRFKPHDLSLGFCGCTDTEVYATLSPSWFHWLCWNPSLNDVEVYRFETNVWFWSWCLSLISNTF